MTPVSRLVDAGAYGCVVQLLAVHLLRLDLFIDRIDELVILPEGSLLGGEFDALLDVQLAVNILRVDQVLADKFLVRSVRQHFAVKLIDHDIQIAIVKLAGLVVNHGVSLLRTLLLDEGYRFLDHGNGFVLARAATGRSVSNKGQRRDKSSNQWLPRAIVQFSLHRLARRYDIAAKIAWKCKPFVNNRPFGVPARRPVRAFIHGRGRHSTTSSRRAPKAQTRHRRNRNFRSLWVGPKPS